MRSKMLKTQSIKLVEFSTGFFWASGFLLTSSCIDMKSLSIAGRGIAGLEGAVVVGGVSTIRAGLGSLGIPMLVCSSTMSP
jgi:hypothetical protein